MSLETPTSERLGDLSPAIGLFGVSRVIDILVQILAFLMASMWSRYAGL